MKLTTEKIGDYNIDIHVTEDGKFTAKFEDQDYRAHSKDELIEDLRKSARKLKVQVARPVTLLDVVPRAADADLRWGNDQPYVAGIGFVHCIFRGVHPRTGALLMADQDGTKWQLASYEGKHNLARMLTPAEEAEYLRLAVAAQAAETAKRDFMKTVLLDKKQLKEDANAETAKA